MKQCDVAIKKIYVRRNQETKLSDVKNLLREVVILRFTKNPQVTGSIDRILLMLLWMISDVDKIESLRPAKNKLTNLRS